MIKGIANFLKNRFEHLNDKLTARLLSIVIVLCGIPYLVLLIYLVIGLHKLGNGIIPPSSFALCGLAIVGGIIPFLSIVCLVYKLIKDFQHFQLIMLLKIYACLIWIFAVWYTLLQIGNLEHAFEGIPQMWHMSANVGLWEHIKLLHEIFFYCLYLSIITMTTVGYGDLIPLIGIARGVTALQSLIGVAFVGLVMGHYFSYSVHKCK